jgi:hypothetical protein
VLVFVGPDQQAKSTHGTFETCRPAATRSAIEEFASLSHAARRFRTTPNNGHRETGRAGLFRVRTGSLALIR